MPRYEQPEDLPGVYKDLKIGEELKIKGISYTVEVLGAEAVSFVRAVELIPNRKAAVVCTMDENKTLYNIQIK